MLGRTDYQTPSVPDLDALSDIWVSTCAPGTSVWVESRKEYYTLDHSSNAVANAIASVQLGSGSGSSADPVMGRPKPWPDGEEERWIEAVYACAAMPSTHHVCVGIETTDTPTSDIWVLEGPEQPPLAYRRKRFAPSGTVQTAWGRVPVSDVPRSARRLP